MGVFTHYRCLLCFVVFVWSFLMLGDILVHGAEPEEELNTQKKRENGVLSASFLEDVDMSDYCLELLHEFGQRYADLSYCLVYNARPVKLCQDCYRSYNSFQDISTNITDQMGPGNVSCHDVLLRSDRLMLLYNLNSSIQDIWTSSACINCLTPNQKNVSNATLHFMDLHNQTLTCFEKYQQGNQSELCGACRSSYKKLSDLYSAMEKTLCIDVEDAMNVTRHLWSTKYKCSLKREEDVPVIAVSCFMLFLPLIFYLSNYLHSEQKKRKLIQPNRARSNHSLMNIQDKYS